MGKLTGDERDNLRAAPALGRARSTRGGPRALETGAASRLNAHAHAHTLDRPARSMTMAVPVCDPAAPKKAVNLSLNSDLLRQARELKINLSKALEESLVQILREERARRWKEENREAIEAHNRFIENYGLFNDIRKRSR
ncbi:MAG: type II toxin-antitoxin system CcdA family antitoxin [Geminicoccaceae bacterium]